MPSLFRRAAIWALVVSCATGCADDGTSGDESDVDGEIVHIDAAVVTGAAASATPGASDAGQSDAAPDAGMANGTRPRDAGQTARLDAGVSNGPSAEAGGAEAASDAAVRDAAVRDAAVRDGGATADAGPSSCPEHGSVRYTLQEKSAPSSAEATAYAKIRAAMDKAIEKYNCYTNLSREVHATYEPGVATADGSTNGSIRFGSEASMHFVTAMHELGHVCGVGSSEFKPLVQNGVFSGKTATAEMRRVTGDAMASVKSDGTHFWPFGLNYVSEYKSEDDLIGHCAIVVAIRKDLGL
jgi:hypothetical protein